MAKYTKFELLEKIGEGGMGEVFRARLFNKYGFEKIVAAKRVIGAISDKSFMREAEVLSKLNHPNICSVFDIKEFEGNLYILMEYIEGMSLSEISEVSIQKGFKFSEEFIFQMALQILKGLEYAHGNLKDKHPIIHRDISPHNIMISESGNVKILDFGIAKIEKTNQTATQSAALGKIRYCAPEVLDGGEHDQLSDLYALGVLLFELIICARAFGNLDELQILAIKEKKGLEYVNITSLGFTEGIKTFIENLSASKKKLRFQSAKEAIEFIFNNNLGKTIEGRTPNLIHELENLKNSKISATQTMPIGTNKRKSQRIWLLIFIPLAIVFVIIVSLSLKRMTRWQPTVRPIDISILYKGSKFELRSIENESTNQTEAKIAAKIPDIICMMGIDILVSIFSISIDIKQVETTKSLELERTPNEHLNESIYRLEQYKFLLDFYKINCSQNISFNKSLLLYQYVNDSILNLAKKRFYDWEDYRQYLVEKNLYTDDLVELNSKFPNYSLFVNTLSGIERFKTPFNTNFWLLTIRADSFPKNVQECRILIEGYWLNRGVTSDLGIHEISEFSAILVPIPLSDENISKYGLNYIEITDDTSPQDSFFRKHGVCVFKRHNGEVVESSLRKM
jgi:serine/threonine protein kinase